MSRRKKDESETVGTLAQDNSAGASDVAPKPARKPSVKALTREEASAYAMVIGSLSQMTGMGLEDYEVSALASATLDAANRNQVYARFVRGILGGSAAASMLLVPIAIVARRVVVIRSLQATMAGDVTASERYSTIEALAEGYLRQRGDVGAVAAGRTRTRGRSDRVREDIPDETPVGAAGVGDIASN